MIVDKILYQEVDTRLNIHEVNAQNTDQDLIAAVIRQARSIACLVDVSAIEAHTNRILSSTFTNYIKNLPKQDDLDEDNPDEKEYGFPLAQDEKFRDELNPGFGTGFLVGPKTLATAAHCLCKVGTNELDPIKIARTRVVFNYTTNPDGTERTHFNANQIFQIREVKAHFYSEGKIDWAWVTLNRVVPNTEPLELDFSPVTKGRNIYMLGHPSGLAMKLSPCGVVQGVSKNCLQAKVDSMGGNSGSPIFDRATKKVIAVLIAGPADDFRVIQNYEGPGVHRVKTVRARFKNTLFKCYEIGQLISTLPIDRQEKTAYYAKLDQDKRLKKSNFKAKLAEIAFSCLTSAEKAAYKVQGVAAICICSKDFHANRKEFADSIQQTDRYVSRIQDLKSTHTINFLEADYMNTHPGMRGLTLPDQLRLARNLAAYGEEDGAAVFSIERLFGDRFSPLKVLELFKFQNKIHADVNTQEFKEYMLEYMHNPIHKMAQAYAKACYKILKRKEGFQDLPKANLRRIAELVVKKAPALSFAQARQELKL
jgi:V8-like Glu-specific endopeptidase